MQYTSTQTYVFTSGSDINQAAEAVSESPGVEFSSGSAENKAITYAPWPPLLGNTNQLDNGWQAPVLREVSTVKVPANYGLSGSFVNYHTRNHEYPGIGGMPGPIPTPNRPTYNNLEPISYRLQVLNPKTMAQPGELIGQTVIQKGDLNFEPGGTASLFSVD